MEMKPIPGFDGYLCDAEGNVYTTRKKAFKRMTPVPDKHGYMRLHIPPTVGAKRKNVFIHTLVAKAWVGGPSTDQQINHKNTVRTDNRPENLEWVTTQENLADCWKRTRHYRIGENHPHAKLSDATVKLIRGLRASGVKRRDIIKQTGLPLITVKNILKKDRRRPTG